LQQDEIQTSLYSCEDVDTSDHKPVVAVGSASALVTYMCLFCVAL
jgi:hypothetical protein